MRPQAPCLTLARSPRALTGLPTTKQATHSQHLHPVDRTAPRWVCSTGLLLTATGACTWWTMQLRTRVLSQVGGASPSPPRVGLPLLLRVPLSLPPPHPSPPPPHP